MSTRPAARQPSAPLEKGWFPNVLEILRNPPTPQFERELAVKLSDSELLQVQDIGERYRDSVRSIGAADLDFLDRMMERLNLTHDYIAKMLGSRAPSMPMRQFADGTGWRPMSGDERAALRAAEDYRDSAEAAAADAAAAARRAAKTGSVGTDKGLAPAPGALTPAAS